ncbi:MAG: hypothetical protein Q9207_007581 [Kuettlingeria erythrocarpa]
MPPPTAAATAAHTGYNPRFTSPAQASLSAYHGIDTTTAPAGQGSGSGSAWLWLFVCAVVAAGWVAWGRESKRAEQERERNRAEEEEEEDEAMMNWARGGAKAKDLRKRAEMEEKIEAAARAAKARMGLSDEVSRMGVAMGTLRVDDRWRYRMRAEDREREMRRRGVPVPVVVEGEECEGDPMDVDDPVLVYAVQQPQVQSRVDTAVAAAVDWMAMVKRVVSTEVRLLTKELLTVGRMAGAVWLAYRVVRFFMKEEYEREGNRVDWFLQLALHVVSGSFLTLILPFLIVFAFRQFLIGLDNAVEICNLCGGGPVDQQHIQYTEGVDLCQGCRFEQEEHIRNEKEWEFWKKDAVLGGMRLEARTAAKKKKHDEMENARKASTLPSGQQFSPVPWRQPPPRPSVLSQLCSSEDEEAGYSGYRHQNPAQNHRQKQYNSFEAKQAFMTPIAEEDEYAGPTTRSMRKGMQSRNTWNDALFAEADARLPIETRRLLRPRPTTSWEKTPNKRFL